MFTQLRLNFSAAKQKFAHNYRSDPEFRKTTELLGATALALTVFMATLPESGRRQDDFIRANYTCLEHGQKLGWEIVMAGWGAGTEIYCYRPGQWGRSQAYVIPAPSDS